MGADHGPPALSHRYIRSERSVILINFCLSIISSNALILIGQSQTRNKVGASHTPVSPGGVGGGGDGDDPGRDLDPTSPGSLGRRGPDCQESLLLLWPWKPCDSGPRESVPLPGWKDGKGDWVSGLQLAWQFGMSQLKALSPAHSWAPGSV